MKISIQQFLSDYIAARKLSGTILVAIDNRIVAEKCFGFADEAAGIKCHRDTQYLIGSVTKQFTAVVVLQIFYDMAINRGIDKNNEAQLENAIKEYLNKPIKYYLPKDLWSDGMPWADIVTPHHLLQHSSGIPDYMSLPAAEEFYLKPPDLTRLIRFFKDESLNFVPGTLFSYSNSGYILLEAMVQHLMQISLSEYLHQIIFTPLQMLSTSLPTSGTIVDLKKSDTKYQHLARGYEFEITSAQPSIHEVKKYIPMQIPGGAGGMISNSLDLMRWNNALYSGNIIPELLLNIMLNSSITTGAEDECYAYGIESKSSQVLGKYFFHRGGINGYKAILFYIPKLKISIISLSNLIVAESAMTEEIKNIIAQLPKTLTDKDKSNQIQTIIKNNYPEFEKNNDMYNAMLFADAFLKELELNNISL